jgi:hypothetical protein
MAYAGLVVFPAHRGYSQVLGSAPRSTIENSAGKT